MSATPAEAEQLAKQAVQNYLNSCNVERPQDLANYLMKLCSVAGLMMACAEGRTSAADRLFATGRFVLANGPEHPAALKAVH